MIQKKTLKLSDIGRIVAFTAAIAIIAVLAANLPLVRAFNILDIWGEGSNRENICMTIVNKAVPIMEISMYDRNQPSGYLGYSWFKNITNIDLQNPRTYLASEIPLLGLVDITTFNADVGGIYSGSSEEDKPVEEPQHSDNEEKPVVNPDIDYSKPDVVIYHTHTTESFTPTVRSNYEMIGDHRSTDNNYNVCRIGVEVKRYIEEYYGIAVVHDTTVHDYPSYNGSYSNSKKTMEKLIKQYPESKFIMDIHRDAFPDDDEARKNMVIEIGGEKAAKILFVIGKSNPHWQENYYLALKLNQKIEELYPGLSKGIRIKDMSIYNQDVSNKVVLIEIGAECTTLEESLCSARMVARAMGQLLKSE